MYVCVCVYIKYMSMYTAYMYDVTIYCKLKLRLANPRGRRGEGGRQPTLRTAAAFVGLLLGGLVLNQAQGLLVVQNPLDELALGHTL